MPDDDELGERSDCDACGLAFWVIANNDAEIMAEGLKIEFCPRCGEGIGDAAEREV